MSLPPTKNLGKLYRLQPKLAFFTLVILVFFAVFVSRPVLSHPGHEEPAGRDSTSVLQKQLDEIRQKQEEVRLQLEEARQRKVTLQNEIAYQDAQIELISLKIEETEAEIVALTGQINRLEGVLVNLSEVFAQRAAETYKLKRLGDPFMLILASDTVPDFITKFHYLQRIQMNDRRLLLQVQSAQTNYEEQRAEVQVLHDRLEEQNAELASLKVQKQRLLEVTRNDEKRFQEMLAALQADEEAIEKALSSLVARIAQGIATGTPVAKGQIIGQQGNTGNVYPRPSGDCPECGSHLHYMVFTCNITSNGLSCHANPRPFLDDGQYNKPLNWQYVSQEYGPATCNICGYTFHTGIDLVDYHGAPIFAMLDGTVYYGVDSAGGKYGLIKHRDDFWTGYWHLQ